jgi:hypothetical protein
MMNSRAIDVCATMERRAAARVRNADASAARFTVARSAAFDAISHTRTSLDLNRSWTPLLCSAAAERTRRCIQDAARADAHARSARETSAALRACQLKWGRLRRGLERRSAAHTELRPSTWQD